MAEVFLTAWRRYHELPEAELVLPWLLGTARRVLSTRRRSLKRQSRLAERVASTTPRHADDQAAQRVAAREELRSALDQLPEEELEPLLLVTWDGLTQREAALVLDIPEGTVASRIRRARGRLREILADDGEGGDHGPA